MNIDITHIHVDEQLITPALMVRINVKYPYWVEIPLIISGKIKSEDGKTIALMTEHYSNSSSSIPLKILPSDQKSKIKYDQQPSIYSAELNAILTKEAINHIESLREKNFEKAVKLNLHFLIKYLTLPVEDLRIDSGSFISQHNERITEEYTIKQSDWVQNFAKSLGIGNFLLLELNIPEKHTVHQDWTELYERLRLRVTDIESAIRQGDWFKAMTSGRLFLDNLNFKNNKPHKQFRESLEELFKKDHHTKDGFDSFFTGINSFFHFISKFMHDHSQSGQINPIPLPTKEDAYFVYALAMGILNVIGKKLTKE